MWYLGEQDPSVGKKVSPLATCWVVQPPIPDGFQLVSLLKEKRNYLSNS